MGKPKPQVTRSRNWFFSHRLSMIVHEIGSNDPMALANAVAKEAYSAQADHIDALEKREEAFSEVLHLIKNKCIGCEVADRIEELEIGR